MRHDDVLRVAPQFDLLLQVSPESQCGIASCENIVPAVPTEWLHLAPPSKLFIQYVAELTILRYPGRLVGEGAVNSVDNVIRRQGLSGKPFFITLYAILLPFQRKLALLRDSLFGEQVPQQRSR